MFYAYLEDWSQNSAGLSSGGKATTVHHWETVEGNGNEGNLKMKEIWRPGPVCEASGQSPANRASSQASADSLSVTSVSKQKPYFSKVKTWAWEGQIWTEGTW